MRVFLGIVLLLVSLVVVAIGGVNAGKGSDKAHDGSGKAHGRPNTKPSNFGLIPNFYKVTRTCPQAEQLVRQVTLEKARKDPTLGAKLLRLHYHDCFVKGCDASILLDTIGTNKSEKDARPNLSLGGFEVIDEIKTRVERVCPKTVSCADILALAARDAVSFPFKKPMWDVLTGRRDGAHTIGVAHCGAFSRRLFNFTGKGDADPSLDPNYVAFLRKQCPSPPNPTTTVGMDPNSTLTFDSHYFTAVNRKQGLFQSDAALLTDPTSAGIVANFQSPAAFFSQFAKSMVKMGGIEVVVGDEGEIRKNCRLIN